MVYSQMTWLHPSPTGNDPTGAAHLEMVQHLLPGQEQQSLFPDLPGDLRVEERVLSAAIRHPLGEEGKNRMGDLAQDRVGANIRLLMAGTS